MQYKEKKTNSKFRFNESFECSISLIFEYSKSLKMHSPVTDCLNVALCCDNTTKRNEGELK